MAETLGSLVDKLSIKKLRLWHMDEQIEAGQATESELETLKAKKALVEDQCRDMIEEINGFFVLALEGKIKVRDQKLKLYKNLNVENVDSLQELGAAISELAWRNIRLWHLEDEVRRTDLSDSNIVACKRKIDKNNQERNDLIDKVDQILEQKTKENASQ